MEKKKNLILLHGFGEDHKVFETQKVALDHFCTVFTPDLPGSGELSNFNIPIEPLSIEWLCDWVYNTLEANQMENYVLLGHSMGGYIALAFAEKYPKKLEGLGLIHSTSYADSNEKKATRERAISFIQEKGGFTFLKAAIPNLFGEDFRQQEPKVIEGLVEEAVQFSDDWLVAYYRAIMARPDRSSVLKESAVPVLIIAGEEDLAAPAPDLAEQAALPAICHFHLLEKTGHMGMLERKTAINEILLNFMGNI